MYSYKDNDRIVFTALTHINRGSCCGNKCKHCPYTTPHKKGNTMKKKQALYLDDERTPVENIPDHEPWVVVRNYDEFTDWITKNGVPNFISFDHDLAKEHVDDFYEQFMNQGYQHPAYDLYKEKTGLDCARWLADYCQETGQKLNKVSVHSFNPVGGSNIQSFINGFKKHMGWEPDCFMMKHKFINEKGEN
jgi:hypothetical protein